MALPDTAPYPILEGRGQLERGTIDRLVHFRSADAPVFSLYLAVPADPGEAAVATRLHSMIKSVRELAESDELDRDARLSLRSDIDRVLELADRGPELRGKAVAVFACNRAGLYEEIQLRRTVRDHVEVDTTPYLRPLMAVLEEDRRWCAFVVDRARSWLFTGSSDEVHEARKLEEQQFGRRNRAEWHGEGEETANNRERTLARRHFRETAQEVEKLFQDEGAELLVVGGHEETVAEFLPFLPRRLNDRIAGTFAIDTRTMTPAEVREEAERAVETYERTEERRLVDEVLQLVAAGGLGAAGLEWCLAAVNEHAVQLLLVNDEDREPGRACDRCGWLGLRGDACPVCGEPTRTTPDVIDEMAATVIDTGGSVEHVHPGTELDGHEVAAFLRFPVPSSPPAGADVMES